MSAPAQPPEQQDAASVVSPKAKSAAAFFAYPNMPPLPQPGDASYDAQEPPYYVGLYEQHVRSVSYSECQEVTQDFAQFCSDLHEGKLLAEGDSPAGPFASNDGFQALLDTPAAQYSASEGWNRRRQLISTFVNSFFSRAVTVCAAHVKHATVATVADFQRRDGVIGSYMSPRDGLYCHVWKSTSQGRRFIAAFQRLWQTLFEHGLGQMIRAPVAAMCMYKGHLITVAAAAPLVDATSVAHRDVMGSPCLGFALRSVHSALGARGSLEDLRLHRGSDGRWYIMALDGLLDLNMGLPSLDANGYARPEAYQALLAHALAPTQQRTDTPPSLGARGGNLTPEAVRSTVTTVLVPKAAEELMNQARSRSLTVAAGIKDGTVGKVLHQAGANMRFLYLLLETIRKEYTSEERFEVVQELIIKELVCRTVKDMLRADLRNAHGETEAVQVDRVNRLMSGISNKKQDVWSTQFHTVMRTKFSAPKQFNVPLSATIVKQLASFLSSSFGCSYDKKTQRFAGFVGVPIRSVLFTVPPLVRASLEAPPAAPSDGPVPEGSMSLTQNESFVAGPVGLTRRGTLDVADYTALLRRGTVMGSGMEGSGSFARRGTTLTPPVTRMESFNFDVKDRDSALEVVEERFTSFAPPPFGNPDEDPAVQERELTVRCAHISWCVVMARLMGDSDQASAWAQTLRDHVAFTVTDGLGLARQQAFPYRSFALALLNEDDTSQISQNEHVDLLTTVANFTVEACPSAAFQLHMLGKHRNDPGLLMAAIKTLRRATWMSHGFVAHYFAWLLEVVPFYNVTENVKEIRDALTNAVRLVEVWDTPSRRAQCLSSIRRVTSALVTSQSVASCVVCRDISKDSLRLHVDKFGVEDPQTEVAVAHMVFTFVNSARPDLSQTQLRDLKKFQHMTASMGSTSAADLKALLSSEAYLTVLAALVAAMTALGHKTAALLAMPHCERLADAAPKPLSSVAKTAAIIQGGAASRLQKLFRSAVERSQGRQLERHAFMDHAYRVGVYVEEDTGRLTLQRLAFQSHELVVRAHIRDVEAKQREKTINAIWRDRYEARRGERIREKEETQLKAKEEREAETVAAAQHTRRQSMVQQQAVADGAVLPRTRSKSLISTASSPALPPKRKAATPPVADAEATPAKEPSTPPQKAKPPVEDFTVKHRNERKAIETDHADGAKHAQDEEATERRALRTEMYLGIQNLQALERKRARVKEEQDAERKAFCDEALAAHRACSAAKDEEPVERGLIAIVMREAHRRMGLVTDEDLARCALVGTEADAQLAREKQKAHYDQLKEQLVVKEEKVRADVVAKLDAEFHAARLSGFELSEERVRIRLAQAAATDRESLLTEGSRIARTLTRIRKELVALEAAGIDGAATVSAAEQRRFRAIQKQERAERGDIAHQAEEYRLMLAMEERRGKERERKDQLRAAVEARQTMATLNRSDAQLVRQEKQLSACLLDVVKASHAVKQRQRKEAAQHASHERRQKLLDAKEARRRANAAEQARRENALADHKAQLEAELESIRQRKAEMAQAHDERISEWQKSVDERNEALRKEEADFMEQSRRAKSPTVKKLDQTELDERVQHAKETTATKKKESAVALKTHKEILAAVAYLQQMEQLEKATGERERRRAEQAEHHEKLREHEKALLASRRGMMEAVRGEQRKAREEKQRRKAEADKARAEARQARQQQGLQAKRSHIELKRHQSARALSEQRAAKVADRNYQDELQYAAREATLKHVMLVDEKNTQSRMAYAAKLRSQAADADRYREVELLRALSKMVNDTATPVVSPSPSGKRAQVGTPTRLPPLQHTPSQKPSPKPEPSEKPEPRSATPPPEATAGEVGATPSTLAGRRKRKEQEKAKLREERAAMAAQVPPIDATQVESDASEGEETVTAPPAAATQETTSEQPEDTEPTPANTDATTTAAEPQDPERQSNEGAPTDPVETPPSDPDKAKDPSTAATPEDVQPPQEERTDTHSTPAPTASHPGTPPSVDQSSQPTDPNAAGTTAPSAVVATDTDGGQLDASAKASETDSLHAVQVSTQYTGSQTFSGKGSLRGSVKQTNEAPAKPPLGVSEESVAESRATAGESGAEDLVPHVPPEQT